MGFSWFSRFPVGFNWFSIGFYWFSVGFYWFSISLADLLNSRDSRGCLEKEPDDLSATTQPTIQREILRTSLDEKAKLRAPEPAPEERGSFVFLLFFLFSGWFFSMTPFVRFPLSCRIRQSAFLSF